MLEQATLNQAAQVLAGLRPGERADTALRAYFAARRYPVSYTHLTLPTICSV